MSKQITFTIDDHIYESLFIDIQGNRSAFIRKLIQLGSETMLDKGTRGKALQILEDNENLKSEIKKLQLENGMLRKKLKPEDYMTDEEIQQQVENNTLKTNMWRLGNK
jgi:Arc/MetJ-type ribon-helix-helix transcriptional regulator